MVLDLMRGARACLVVAAGLALTGCVSFRPLEPVIAPPQEYRGDTLVPVEFVNPATIGFRCAERGAKFLMLPGINSNACSSPDLVTMPNPCQTYTGGEFATVLCRQLARANGWSTPETEETSLLQNVAFKAGDMVSGGRPPARYQTDNTIPVEFVAPEKLAMRCAERGAKMFKGDESITGCADRDLISMPNPCTVSVNGWYAGTICHEMAHANGWPPNHRGGKLFSAGLSPRVAPSQLGLGDGLPGASAVETSSAPLSAASEPMAVAPASEPLPLGEAPFDNALRGLQEPPVAPPSPETSLDLIARIELFDGETILR